MVLFHVTFISARFQEESFILWGAICYKLAVKIAQLMNFLTVSVFVQSDNVFGVPVFLALLAQAFVSYVAESRLKVHMCVCV